jgi:hypothetical protein
MMMIYCDSFETFCNTIQSLVALGLTFEAHTDDLTIKLTGCY